MRILSLLVLILIAILVLYRNNSQPSVPGLPEGGNHTIDSFSEAKKLLHTEVFFDQRTTFYCGCSYDEKKKIDPASCGFEPRKDKKRASRLEWEHVVPAENFGRSFPEWREGHPDCVEHSGKPFKGRECARKVNLLFRYMEADLYNLQPEIGEVNGDRSNYRYGEIPGEKREYGACDFEIEDSIAEPREAIRGIIARTFLYMDESYSSQGLLSDKNRKLYEAWNAQYPPDNKECERAKRIEQIQGNKNRFIEEPCARFIPAPTSHQGSRRQNRL